MVEVSQSDGEKASLKCEAIWVWTPEEMVVLFMNCAAVRAAVVLEVIPPVNFVASG